ncbi:hypothetical protein CPC08DRAFT_119169 [Agrocybe pediades]|nr:hypothetical protein CPC08DRAFT_119169 [Agrocybe pediades]
MKTSLRTCSVTARTFVNRSQKHIFSSLALLTSTQQLNSPKEVKEVNPESRLFVITPHHLRWILENSPHIAHYVHYLRLVTPTHPVLPSETTKDEEQLHRTNISFCLRQLSRLKGFSIDAGVLTSDSSGFFQAVQDAAISTALTCLHYSSLPNIFLSQRRHIEYLSFCIGLPLGDSFAQAAPESDDIAPGQPRTRCTVRNLMVKLLAKGTTAGDLTGYLNRSLDITNLETLAATVAASTLYHINMRNILDVCGKNLQRFVLNYRPSTPTSLGWSRNFTFSLNSLKSLRRFHVIISALNMDNAVSDFVRLLKSLPTGSASCLEELYIAADYTLRGMSPKAIIESWDELWSHSTDLDHFPRLKKLIFTSYFTADNVTYVIKWRNHFSEKLKFLPYSLKGNVELILSSANPAQQWDELHPFWPDPRFGRLLKATSVGRR